MKPKKQSVIPPKPKQEEQSEMVFALGKTNVKLIGIAFLVIIIGFLLMLGGGSTADTYNPDIFSFRRIVLAPGIAFAGFVFMVYAIMYKSAEGDKKARPRRLRKINQGE